MRDLAREPLPHIDDDFVAATRGPAASQTDEQRVLLARSDTLVDELLAAVPLALQRADVAERGRSVLAVIG